MNTTKIIQLNSAVLMLCMFLHVTAFAQELEAYRIYNNKGKQVEFGAMVNQLNKNQVILFGELHNNPICHWMQWELTKACYEKNQNMVLGAEMFETDDQVVIDEYLSDQIKLDHLKKEAKVWPNFATDYQPLLDFSKEKNVPFIATNTPRRYASLVSKEGIEGLNSLSVTSKAFLPPLPYEVLQNDSGYADMRIMMGGHGMDVELLVAAQALKDYTMAYNINRNLSGKGLFIHFNGSFHSQKFSGIYGYLKEMNKDTEIGVIAVVEEDSLEYNKDWKGLGDFVIVVPSSMTKTH
jgi:uncharacterized iron-regulated protein